MEPAKGGAVTRELRNRMRMGAGRVALIYALLGVLWILFSDRVLLAIVDDVAALAQLQTYKGWFYVAVTAALLYHLVRGALADQSTVERALVRSEARFRAIFEGANDPIFIHDADSGAILDVNARAAEAYGYSLEDLRATSIAQLSADDPRFSQEVALEWVRKARDGGSQVFEWLARHRDGHSFWVEVNMSTAVVDDRTIVIVVVRDIQARKRAEEDLREQATLIRLFFDLPFIGMAITSPQTRRWVAVNDRLCQILGYDSEELIELTWAELTHPDDLVADAQQFERMLCAEIDGYELDKRFVRKDGTVIFSTINIRCTREEDGRVRDVVAMVQDITQRKQAEEALQALNAELEARVADRTAQLEAANRELESFSYAVSHDLKAPLRGIDGYSDILLEDYAQRLDAEGQQILNKIRAGVRQMHELIEDMLAYSRMERRTLEAHPIELDMLTIAVTETYQGAASERGVAIDAQLPPISVRVDRDGLTLVLRNLMENALKFTRDVVAPKIEVGARDLGEYVLMWVRDNGVGFDMKYHERIFEIFQRLHRAEDYPGTGIGLALVKKAVHRMGGRVWAESKPGEGAVFYLELPK